MKSRDWIPSMKELLHIFLPPTYFVHVSRSASELWEPECLPLQNGKSETRIFIISEAHKEDESDRGLVGGMCQKPFRSLKNSIRKSRCWYCNYYLIPKWWGHFQECALLDEPIHFQSPLMNLGIEYLSSWNNWHISAKRLHSSDEIPDSYWERGERRVTGEQYCFMGLHLGY